jgi:hypothetical protein
MTIIWEGQNHMQTCFGLGISVSPFSDGLEYPSSRDSSVDVATGYGLDDRGVGVPVPVGPEISSSRRRPKWF